MTEHHAKLKWFTIHQNNSGGSFEVNDNVAHVVCIQDYTAQRAMDRAERFCDNYGSCPCCGDRWSFYADDAYGTDEPTMYGDTLDKVSPYFKGELAKLHYLEGRVETVELKSKEDV
jgi:hypothetical protein